MTVSPNQPLTLRPSTPGGPRRLHNDNRPAEADIEPLTVEPEGPTAEDLAWDETLDAAERVAWHVEEEGGWQTGVDAVETVVAAARELRSENKKLRSKFDKSQNALRKSKKTSRRLFDEVNALRADLDALAAAASASPEIALRLAAVLASADERAAGRRD